MDAQQWKHYLAENKRRQRENLAENVRFYRLLRRMTTRKLAAASGCSLDTIYRVEHQKGDTRLRTEERLAAALGVDRRDLLVDTLPQSLQEVPQKVHERRAERQVSRPEDRDPKPRGPSRAERRKKKRKKK